MLFQTVLLEVRKKYYPDSAKKAWEIWKSRGLEVNYPYYMRLEQGKALPSAEVVSQIAQQLLQSDREKLVLSYCMTLFPAEKNLFAKSHLTVPLQKPNKEKDGSKAQKELKMRQIQALAESKTHYQIFVVLLLARSGIDISELQKKFEGKQFALAFRDLENSQLVYSKEKVAYATHTDVRFPDPLDPHLQKIYLQFDLWDREFSKDFKFESLFKKKVVRRVSLRYLKILTQQLELTSEIVKSSDEVDPLLNDEVVVLELSLQRGRVPG